MRLIQIVENLDLGAVENWLVNVFVESRSRRPEWEWTFYCTLGRPGRLDEKVRAAGGRIIHAPCTVSDRVAFLRHLRKTLTEGNFDVMHAHHDYLSGFYLIAAVGLPIRRRIVHLHNNDRALPVGSPVLRKMLLPVFRRLVLSLSDEVVAISEHTRDDFRQGHSGRRPLFSVLYYGIDMSRYGLAVDRDGLHARLGIPASGRILLYAGRMIREKNPVFVVDVLKALLDLRNDVHAVFVGKGELDVAVRARAEALGVADHVHILGWTNDMAGMMGASDAFVFPRLEHPREGLGLVVVEAQCAGLPFFITEGIVHDAVVIEEMAHYLSPKDPPAWAAQLDALLNAPPPVERGEALHRMRASRFELGNATDNLTELYEKGLREN